jgi:hypothetical protein
MARVFNKNWSNHQLIFGDFDRDKVKNIDDPYPFDNRRRKYPAQTHMGRYYRKVRYGNRETKMSVQLQAIESYNRSYEPVLARFLKAHPNAYGRVKTVASTIQKLRNKGLESMYDVGAVAIELKKRQDVMRAQRQFKRGVVERKNYYRDPKQGVYYAYHLLLKDPKSRKVFELQLKTRRQARLHDKMHGAYKTGVVSPALRNKAKQLYNEGY